jgi:predicted nucleic acid-binding protein
LARLFLDTSALIKLYRIEPDSPVIIAQIAPDDDLLLSGTTPLEVYSAFRGMERRGEITATVASAYIGMFELDRPKYNIQPVDSLLVPRATSLLNTHLVAHNLRLLDSLQLASALLAHSGDPLDALISTDNALRAAAAAEGLTVLPL